MKKALLVVDHKERDLRGIVLIACWLYAKYGVYPFITNTKNEISSLIKYRPDLILLQHVRHNHQKEFLDFAKAQGTTIAVLASEGFPNYPENILFTVGREDYFQYIDLLLTWGDIFINKCNRHHLIRHAEVVAVGSPRFDYHTSFFSSLCMTKESFCKLIGIDLNMPIVLWMTNGKYANPPEGMEAFIRRTKSPDFSDHRIAATIEPKARDHQRVYDVVSDYLLKLAADFPKVNFLIKVHPAEPVEVYYKKYKNHKNVKIIDSLNNFSLSDLIRHSDIQLNFRCTTSAEAWMMDINKIVIGFESADLELDEFNYLASGCDMVDDYASLKVKISHYLNGGNTEQSLMQLRTKFIKDFLYSNDGKSAQRCAKVIADHISDKSNVVWGWDNYKTFMRYLPKYRFNNKWVAMHRGTDHPKHIDPALVKAEADICSQEIIGKEINYRYL